MCGRFSRKFIENEISRHAHIDDPACVQQFYFYFILRANLYLTCSDKCMAAVLHWVCLAQSCLSISCLVLSCLGLSCLGLSFLVLSCRGLSYLSLTYLALSCLVLSCLALTCLVLSCFALSWLDLSCLDLSCLSYLTLPLSCLTLPCPVPPFHAHFFPNYSSLPLFRPSPFHALPYRALPSTFMSYTVLL
jgi:hypothetical protein